MDIGTSSAMAELLLQLHQEYDFTHACATDGAHEDSPSPGEVEPRSAFGVWHGAASPEAAPLAYGGALPPGSTVQDAEMRAIEACLSHVAAATAVGSARLLVLGDSLAVLTDIEAVWRSGSIRNARKRHRRAMLERILLLRRDHFEDVVFMWTPSHVGVFANQYADMVAGAFLSSDPSEPEHDLRSTLVRYQGLRGYPSASPAVEGVWDSTPWDRRVHEMVRRRASVYAALRVAGWDGDASHSKNVSLTVS